MTANTDIQHFIAEMAQEREQCRRSLATIESRIALMHAELRRTSETVTRLKLTLDNAKKLAMRNSEALERLGELLAAKR